MKKLIWKNKHKAFRVFFNMLFKELENSVRKNPNINLYNEYDVHRYIRIRGNTVPKTKEELFERLFDNPYGESDDSDLIGELKKVFDFDALRKKFNKKRRLSKNYYTKDTTIEEVITDIIRVQIEKHPQFKSLFIEDDTEENPTILSQISDFQFFWKFRDNTYAYLTQRNKKKLDISSEEKFYDSLKVLGPGSKMEEGIVFKKPALRKLVPYVDFLINYEMHLKSYDHRIKMIINILEQRIKEHGPITTIRDGEKEERKYYMFVEKFYEELPKEEFHRGFEIILAPDENYIEETYRHNTYFLEYEEKKAIFDYKEIYRKLAKYYKKLNLSNKDIVNYFENKKSRVKDDDIEGLIPEDDDYKEAFEEEEASTEITNPAPVIDSDTTETDEIDTTETDSDVTEPDTAGTQ